MRFSLFASFCNGMTRRVSWPAIRMLAASWGRSTDLGLLRSTVLFQDMVLKRKNLMSKYYVQSGTMRTVVQAETTRKAALWAVHQAMQQVLPMEGNLTDSDDLRMDAHGQDGVAVLSQRVCISERGFDRDDSISLPTMEVVTDWNEMVVTLDRLEKMLYQAK